MEQVDFNTRDLWMVGPKHNWYIKLEVWNFHWYDEITTELGDILETLI